MVELQPDIALKHKKYNLKGRNATEGYFWAFLSFLNKVFSVNALNFRFADFINKETYLKTVK